MTVITRRTDRPWRRLRRRGLSLVEMIMYLTVTAGVIIFTVQVLDQERQRRDETSAAADLAQVIDATQIYVAENYDGIVQELFLAAQSAIGASRPLFAYHALTDTVIDAGLLPWHFTNGGGTNMNTLYGQEYRILMRGVLRSDTARPRATADFAAVTNGAAPPEIQEQLRNGVFVPDDPGTMDDELDDELELEVLLVSIDQPPDPWVRPVTFNNAPPLNQITANSIAAKSGTAAAGVFQHPTPGSSDLVASGPFAGWEYDYTEFSLPFEAAVAADPNLDAAPREGNFAALIALPDYGVLSGGEGPRAISGRSIFDICREAAANAVEYQDCLMDDQVRAALVFNLDDSAAFPGFENVFRILMTDPVLSGVATDDPSAFRSRIEGVTFLGMEPYSSVAGGRTDSFAEIRNVSQIKMASPVDTDASGDPDVFPELRNVYGLSCAAGGTTALEDGRITVDCAETYLPDAFRVSVSDGLEVTGLMNFMGSVSIQSTAPRMLIENSANDYVSLSDQAISLFSDSGVPSRLEPSVVSAGRLEAAELAAREMMLTRNGTDVDVTGNVLTRTVTAVAPGGGAAVTFATGNWCPTGMTRTRGIAEIRPPGSYTRIVNDGGGTELYRVDYDRITGIDVLSLNDFTVSVRVTYGRLMMTTDSDNESCVVVSDAPGLYMESCTYAAGPGILVDTIKVDNPAGMKVTAILGCE